MTSITKFIVYYYCRFLFFFMDFGEFFVRFCFFLGSNLFHGGGLDPRAFCLLLIFNIFWLFMLYSFLFKYLIISSVSLLNVDCDLNCSFFLDVEKEHVVLSQELVTKLDPSLIPNSIDWPIRGPKAIFTEPLPQTPDVTYIEIYNKVVPLSVYENTLHRVKSLGVPEHLSADFIRFDLYLYDYLQRMHAAYDESKAYLIIKDRLQRREDEFLEATRQGLTRCSTTHPFSEMANLAEYRALLFLADESISLITKFFYDEYYAYYVKNIRPYSIKLEREIARICNPEILHYFISSVNRYTIFSSSFITDWLSSKNYSAINDFIALDPSLFCFMIFFDDPTISFYWHEPHVCVFWKSLMGQTHFIRVGCSFRYALDFPDWLFSSEYVYYKNCLVGRQLVIDSFYNLLVGDQERVLREYFANLAIEQELEFERLLALQDESERFIARVTFSGLMLVIVLLCYIGPFID